MMEMTSKSSKFGAARMRHRSSPDRSSLSSSPTTARDDQTYMKRQLSSSPRHTKLSLSKPTPFSHVISDHNHNLSYGASGYSTSTKLLALLIGLVICVWIAMISIMMFHVTYQDDPIYNKLPIPLSTVRHKDDEVITNHHLRRKNQHNIINKMPKNYFQLSPPTSKTATKSSQYDSPPPWSWPIIHIVTTRFMQGQGTLINLARSRLKLLEVILLPSLMEQTIFDLDTLYGVYEGTKWEEEIEMLLNSKHHHFSLDPNFLWIIKVDPNLDETVLNELKAVLEPVKHFTLVVGSNTNFGIGVKPGGFRGGEAGQDILHAYDNGHLYFPESLHNNNDNAYETLRRAHDARNDRVVLETRIDSDDAVNVDYFATLQNIAIRTLVDRNVSEYDEGKHTEAESTNNDNEHEPSKKQSQQTAKWLYWCPQTHVQWNPSSEHQSMNDNPGMLQVFQMPNTCVTAGLTLGFAIGSKEENVPRYPHDKIYWEIVIHHNNENMVNNTTLPAAVTDEADIHHCGLYPSKQCAVFVTDPHVSAFRTRAMTSAGMHNIEAGGEPTVKTPKKYKDYAADLWRGTIEKQFGIKTERVKEAADFMLENYLGIVRDNLKGQCTHGHSCKESSLEKLQRTIDILEEEIGGVEVKDR